ncbi:unnamed protein product, partial [Closterium sp. NIES-54]
CFHPKPTAGWRPFPPAAVHGGELQDPGADEQLPAPNLCQATKSSAPFPLPATNIWVANPSCQPQYMEDSCNSVILFHTPVSIGSPHHQPGGQPIPPAQYTGAQNTGKSCKSLSRSFNCQSNGRTNMRYLQYEWRSPGCRIERFDASAFLERVRNKVFLVVGDSVSMNFISALQCLIETATPTKVCYAVQIQLYTCLSVTLF